MWNWLAIISIVFLALSFWRGRNAVWGGLTAGIAVGLIVAVVYVLLGHGFQWTILEKGAIIGVLAGVVAELLSWIGAKSKR